MKLSITITTEALSVSGGIVRHGEKVERTVVSIADAELGDVALADTLRAIADSIDPRYDLLATARAGEVTA